MTGEVYISEERETASGEPEDVYEDVLDDIGQEGGMNAKHLLPFMLVPF